MGRRAARWTRRALIVLVAAVVVYVLWAIWESGVVMRWMERARPVPFFAAMALLPAIGAPLTPFCLLAGATFGLAVALIGAALALAANLALCYLIGRGRLRRRVGPALERVGYRLPDFDAAVGDQSFLRTARFAAIVKLAPGVPNAIKSYALAAARVPFATYMGISLTITFAYAAALIVLGDALLEREPGRGMTVLLVALAAALGLWWWIRRRTDSRAAAAAAAAEVVT